MAIELRKCECGCGKTKYATERWRFYSGTCRKRVWRKKQKEKDNEQV